MAADTGYDLRMPGDSVGEVVVGTAVDGAVTALVDPDGRLLDLTIAPHVLDRSAARVAEAVRAAVTSAQDTAAAARDGLSDADRRRFVEAMDDVGMEADRRLAMLTTLASMVAQRVGRP